MQTATTVRIRPELMEQIEALATTLGMNRTETINHLIREYTSIEARRIDQRRRDTEQAIRGSTGSRLATMPNED